MSVPDDSYIKYLSPARGDEEWGISLTTVGHARYAPKAQYPASRHPGSHVFSPQAGRVLDEYQIVYITDGQGYFESASAPHQNVAEGTVLLLFPGEWHSYYPDPVHGWHEYWIGFRGLHADNAMSPAFFTRQSPVINIGVSTLLVELFKECMSLTDREPKGYRMAASGIVQHMLGHIYLKSSSPLPSDSAAGNIISRARIIMADRIIHGLSPIDIASSLGVSYSWFRQTFKRITGVSPVQYHTQLIMNKAKELLVSDRSISEVAFALGFDNASQFSTMFRKREGITPTHFRNTNRFLPARPQL